MYLYCNELIFCGMVVQKILAQLRRSASAQNGKRIRQNILIINWAPGARNRAAQNAKAQKSDGNVQLASLAH